MSWLRSTNTWRAGAALAGLLALAACDKGTELGVDLPEVADINARFLDLPLGVSTVQYDSVETLKSDHFLAGQLRDGVAGLTTATAVLNLQASTLTDSLPSRFAGARLDSVVFAQGFDAVYGSSSVPARFDLMRLVAPLSETEPYTSSSVPVVNATAVATNLSSRLDRIIKTVNHGPDSSAANQFIYTPDPTVRLKAWTPGSLNQVFFDLFGDMKSTTFVFNQAKLEQRLAGLALKPSANYEQAILSFTRSTQSKLSFYFSVAPTTGTFRKWRSYNIYYGPAGGTGGGKANDPRYYTYLESAKGSSLLDGLVSGKDTIPAARLSGLSYVQDGIGLGTRLEFKSRLDPLRKLKNVAINRAELFVPVKPFSTALWPNVNGLFALEVNQNNQVLQRTSGLTLVERIVQRSGASPTGVNNEALALLYDAKTATPYFSVDITNYLQAYLNNQLDGPLPAALVLLPTIRRSQNLTLNRSVIDVGGAGRMPRLRVYYSELR